MPARSSAETPVATAATGEPEAHRARRRLRPDRRRIVACLALVLGLWLLGTAVAMPVKGRLGHVLLERTFSYRLAADPLDRANPDRWRPWPWADLAPIGELHFPANGENRVVVDSASGEAMAWAVGHVPGTAGLGERGITAIAGHRDGRFALLGDLSVGDTVELATLSGERIRYVVESLQVVDATETQLRAVHDGPDELVLTTCWPIDAIRSGPDRLLVRAIREVA